MQSHANEIGLQFEEAGANNQEGLGPSLLDLFCDYRESTLLGQITAALMESGYHGALLVKRLEEFRASQYFRDLIDDYRAHISRVGAEDAPTEDVPFPGCVFRDNTVSLAHDTVESLIADHRSAVRRGDVDGIIATREALWRLGVRAQQTAQGTRYDFPL